MRTLGFDLNTWQPTPRQAADYAESREQGYGYGPDLHTHLARVLSAPRSVHLGNDCPLDRTPYGDGAGPHNELNAFGLHIAYDTYRAELTSDVTAVHGGDGGESVCGGYGHLLAWLPLATANRNPHTAEFVHGPDGEGLYDNFSTRPVLTL